MNQKEARRQTKHVAIIGGIGASTGSILQFAIYRMHWNPQDWKTQAVSVAMAVFIGLLVDSLRSSGREPPTLTRWQIRGPLGTLLAAVVVEALQALATKDSIIFAIGVGNALTATIVTWSWIRGAPLRSQGAMKRGVLSGVVVGGLTGAAAAFLVVTFVHVPISQARQFALQVWQFVGEGMLEWGLLGLAGGAAVDKGWGRTPTLGIGVSLTVTTVAIITPLTWLRGYGAAAGYSFADYLLSNLFLPLGWGIALLSFRPADRVLSRVEAL